MNAWLYIYLYLYIYRLEASYTSLKIFALQRPEVINSTAGVDASPLFHSNVLLDGDGVVSNFMDDLVIRQRASLLPSGRYGAIFTNVRLLNISAGVRLNFTLSYPGDLDYFDILQSGDSPPPAFERAGVGYTTYQHIYNSSSQLLGNPSHGPPYFGDEVIPDLYRGYDERVVMLGANAAPHNLSCALVSDPIRAAWCLQFGYTIEPSPLPTAGCFITAPIIVQRECTKAVHVVLKEDDIYV